jgi:shikimate dehydrogenase
VDSVIRQVRASPEAKVEAIFLSLPKARLRAALVGCGIHASRTPGMHEAEGARLGLDYAYVLLDLDALDLPESALGDVLEAARRHGFAGLNVTHPFKQSIVPHLDELSEEAAAIGAINTVVFRTGRATGHNTDCWGFAESFRAAMQGADLDRVLLLGAGGAGRAVAHALLQLGAREILVYDIDRSRSAELCASIGSGHGSSRFIDVDDVADAAQEASGIVNTTPVGMTKYPGMPLPATALRPRLWVADIVYFPAETELLRAAAAAGCRTMSGRGMAVFQAVRAFDLIAGVRPDPQAMSRHFDDAAAQRLD